MNHPNDGYKYRQLEPTEVFKRGDRFAEEGSSYWDTIWGYEKYEYTPLTLAKYLTYSGMTPKKITGMRRIDKYPDFV
jgi:hypothetical protein